MWVNLFCPSSANALKDTGSNLARVASYRKYFILSYLYRFHLDDFIILATVLLRHPLKSTLLRRRKAAGSYAGTFELRRQTLLAWKRAVAGGLDQAGKRFVGYLRSIR
jgi:hypothetical protein